ncbi:hypothetical protein [Actinomadura chibensis]|uniref:DUF3558 domain-containing protein n=1 Tax=Actinomadura chibensis TaxID=392828 RepID=A0A5D0NUR7_9ACTN|nr:hypothetical protein [Actinomadura chibensis]TYB48135.1 hypothetical protein FXF69_02615 [Actinomadura chibensis]
MSDSGPPGPAPRWWTGRGRQAAAATIALVLAVSAAVAVAVSRDPAPRGISDGPLLAAPAGADRVPAGRVVTKLPRNCGVSDATAARLAPGSGRDAEKGNVFRQGGPGSCMWYSLDDGKAKCGFCVGDFRNERVLYVDITLSKGRRQSPITEAMQALSPAGPDRAASPVPPKLVEGLGEEATARYSAEVETEGAEVGFRVGNAVVSVRYKGWDDVRGRRRTIPEKTALDGALAAAAETARSMGAAARPVLSAVKNPVTPPLRAVPKPCDTVPAPTVDKVAREAYRRRGSATLITTAAPAGMSLDACVWNARTSRFANEGRSRTLTVSLAVAGERLPGLGTFTATRQFLGVYQDQREGKSPGLDAFTGFTPLTGPGERAFAVTKVQRGASDGDVGLVVFQKRNVLVEVAYQGSDEDVPLTGRRLVDSAYTVAVAVERSLRS